jgi:two-component system, sensor histidine kinase and response regulator
MAVFPSSPLTCELSWDLFESLAVMVQSITSGGQYYDCLDRPHTYHPGIPLPTASSTPTFILGVSDGFSLLVRATKLQVDRLQVSLSFAPEVIEAFSGQYLNQTLCPQENQAQAQGQFTMQLMQLVMPKLPVLHSEADQAIVALEEQLKTQSQALKDSLVASHAADRAKSEFLATMNHELRTPLTCIIGMASTLLRPQIHEHLPPHRQQAHLQIIRDRGQNLLALINDLLDLSKFETGREILRLRDFSMVQLASQTLRSFQEKAETKEIHLGFEVRAPEHNPNGRFYADPQRVRQMLINLLSNALKFTPEGGSVTLRVMVDSDHAAVQVEDTGIGIPIEQHSHIFKKFQQIDSSYQRKYEGTGLGLSLTKLLVDLHGGRIEVESTMGEGSCFTVWLPKHEIAGGDQEQIPVAGPFYPRVLLVESQEITANLICDLLTAADYQVIWMIDADTALYQVDVVQPTVVIVDFGQPDGPKALEELNRHDRRSTMRILAFVKDAGSWDQAQKLGADECLIGPVIWPEELIDKVDSLMC